VVKWIEHAYGECLVHFSEKIFDVALDTKRKENQDRVEFLKSKAEAL